MRSERESEIKKKENPARNIHWTKLRQTRKENRSLTSRDLQEINKKGMRKYCYVPMPPGNGTHVSR